jgi:hypothetical protein
MDKIAKGQHFEGREWPTDPHPVFFFQHEVWKMSYMKKL